MARSHLKNSNRRGGNNKTRESHSEDMVVMRKLAAVRLNAVGNDVRQLQKDNPQRWGPEKRRRVNVDIKRLQFCYDEKDYRNVLEFSDLMVDEYQLTITRLKPPKESKPREDKPRNDRNREKSERSETAS